MHTAAAASFAYIFGVDEAPHSASFIIIISAEQPASPFIARSLCQDGMPLI